MTSTFPKRTPMFPRGRLLSFLIYYLFTYASADVTTVSLYEIKLIKDALQMGRSKNQVRV